MDHGLVFICCLAVEVMKNELIWFKLLIIIIFTNNAWVENAKKVSFLSILFRYIFMGWKFFCRKFAAKN